MKIYPTKNKWLRYSLYICIVCAFVYFYYYAASTHTQPEEIDVIELQAIELDCLGEKFLSDMGAIWGDYYSKAYPTNSVKTMMRDWNTLLKAINCDDFQIPMQEVYYSSIVADLQSASSTYTAECPSDEDYEGVFKTWSNRHQEENPTSTNNTLMSTWDGLMQKNGCVGPVGSVSSELPKQ